MQYENEGLNFNSKELRLLFERSSELICISDSKGSITKVNPALEKILGYHSSDLLGRHITSLVDEKDRDNFSRFCSHGNSNQLQARASKRNGDPVWLLWSKCKIPGKGIVYFTAKDLTEIKTANQVIAHSEAKFQRVLSDGKIGYWEVNFNTGELVVSDNIRGWMGVSRGQLLTQELFLNLVHPDDLNKVIESQKAVMETRSPQELTHRTRKPDGSYIWVHGIGHPMFDADGNLNGLMGTSMDITEKVHLEETLEVQRAKMTASSRLSAIGEMATAVAHEINNPLAIISLNAESIKGDVIKDPDKHEEILTRVDKITRTVSRISRIIKSLRSLSRDGQNDPLEPVSMQRILEDALEICKEKFSHHMIDLRVSRPTENMMILGRPTQISQVILNLLNNSFDAVEYHHEPWIEVTIRDLKSEVEISVKDSGNGIPAHLCEKIFEPFYTTKAPAHGTGLGLSVSKNIINAHSGILEINPHSQHTEFVIRLKKLSKCLESRSRI